MIMRFVCKINLSPLETGENLFKCLFSKLEKICKLSPSLLHTREIIADFSQFVCKNSHPLLEPEDRSQDFSQRTPSFSSQYDFLGFSQFAPEGVCASKVDQKVGWFGWISLDLCLISVGHIQDNLFVSFGPKFHKSSISGYGPDGFKKPFGCFQTNYYPMLMNDRFTFFNHYSDAGRNRHNSKL